MGHQIATVTFTNTGPGSCTIRGTPQVKLVAANGALLLDSATSGASGRAHVSSGDKTFKLAHGKHVTIGVQTSNYCGATPTLPTHLVFVLPKSAGTVTLAPAADASSGIPPCLGDPGSAGTIETNGWAT